MAHAYVCGRRTEVEGARLSIIALVPGCCVFVALQGPFCVAQLQLEYLAEVLLLLCRSPEVTTGAVVLDGFVQAPCRVLWALLAVHLERLGHRVGGVIGLLQVVLLDASSQLERPTRFLVYATG